MFDTTRAGHGLGGSGIGQNHCLSVENKFTDNPSVNHSLIGLSRLSGFGRWMSGGLVGFNWPANGFFWIFLGLQVDVKNSVHSFGLFWAILKPNQQLYVIGPTNLVFLAIFLLFI